MVPEPRNANRSGWFPAQLRAITERKTYLSLFSYLRQASSLLPHAAFKPGISRDPTTQSRSQHTYILFSKCSDPDLNPSPIPSVKKRASSSLLKQDYHSQYCLLWVAFRPSLLLHLFLLLHSLNKIITLSIVFCGQCFVCLVLSLFVYALISFLFLFYFLSFAFCSRSLLFLVIMYIVMHSCCSLIPHCRVLLLFVIVLCYSSLLLSTNASHCCALLLQFFVTVCCYYSPLSMCVFVICHCALLSLPQYYLFDLLLFLGSLLLCAIATPLIFLMVQPFQF